MMTGLRFPSIVTLLALIPAQSLAADKAPETIGQVERLDPALDDLIARDVKIEVLADGFDWSEGPLWLPSEKCVIFSDVPTNKIHRWSEQDGLSVYLTPSGYTGDVPRGEELGSNGLLLDQEGRLVICQHGDRRMARMDAPLGKPAAKFITIVDQYQGKRFNSPNDAVYHSSGALYFTDPPYGMPKRFDDQNRELDFQGVFRLDADRTLTLLTKELRAPNGIAFSPDEKRLYVAQSDPKKAIWMAYNVAEDGSIAGGRVFFDATRLVGKGPGLPDGLKVDAAGNLFATGPGGVLVISPEGKHLGTIHTGTAIANCAFGDDGRTLYMTCDMYLCRIRLKTIGDGF